MMANPVLRRELAASLRSRGALACALGYLVALAALVAALWPAGGVYSLAARDSRSIVLVLTLAQLLLIMLYTPAFAATALVAERERRTLDLLLISPLRPHAILLGKLGAATLCLLAFVAFSLPFFAVCFLLGAVSLPELARLYGLLAATSALLALLGLAVSLRAPSSHAALMRSYLLLLLLAAGPWLPGLLLPGWTGGAPLLHALRALSPVAALASVLVPDFDPPAADGGAWASWRLYTWYLAALLPALLGALVVAFGRPAAPPAHTAREEIRPAPPRLRFPFYLLDPQRRRRPIADWTNPVFAKELRNQAFGGGLGIIRWTYLSLAGSMLLIVLAAGALGVSTPDAVLTIALSFQLGLVVLVVPSLTAGAISQEREQQNLDLLKLTFLTPGRLLRGKLQVAGIFLLFLFAGAVPLWGALLAIQFLSWAQLGRFAALALATVALALGCGLAGSACARRTPTASAIAYALTFAFGLITLLPLLLPDQLHPAWQRGLLAANPFAAATQLLTSGALRQFPPLWPTYLAGASAATLALWALAYWRVRRLFQPER